MSGRTQLFEASSTYQVMLLAAALDSGAFGPADRRILLTSANSAVPEVAPRIVDDPAIAPVLGRFDAVASWNDLIAPLHPKGFRPRAGESPLLLRGFLAALGIPESHVVELALESVHAPPARSILTVFAESAATVYAEGLMSYGPTRDELPQALWSRIDRVLHLDLVPGLTPLLLAEHGIPSATVDAAAFRAVVAEVAAAYDPPRHGPYALILGQYLAALGLLSARAEERIYVDLVDAAVAAGFTEVVYKPHPSAPPSYATALRRHAEQSGAHLVVQADRIPAEALFEADPPGLVLGCFSTGLVTASRFWNIPVAVTGTGALLRSLPAFEDSNRVPVALAHLTLPHVAREDGTAVIVPASAPSPPALQQALDALGYAMQWRSRAHARSEAAAILADATSAARRVVPADRLQMLRLPGSSRPLEEDAFVRWTASRQRRDELKELGASGLRRAAGLLRRS